MDGASVNEQMLSSAAAPRPARRVSQAYQFISFTPMHTRIHTHGTEENPPLARCPTPSRSGLSLSHLLHPIERMSMPRARAASEADGQPRARIRRSAVLPSAPALARLPSHLSCAIMSSKSMTNQSEQ